MLTRGIRAFFDQNLIWDNPFNEAATNNELRDIFKLKDRLSRLKIWIVEKK